MKFFKIIPIVTFFTFVAGKGAVAPTNFEFNLEEREFGEEFYDDIFSFAEELLLSKRDDTSASAQAIESVLVAVNSSGALWTLVDSVAASNSTLDSLANTAISLLSGNSSSSSGLSLNISLNTSELLDKVMSSGIIQSTASGLLLNNATNDKLAGVVGHVLKSVPWVAEVLKATGDGKKITIDFLADLIQNSTSKDPNFSTDSQKQAVFSNTKRNENGTEGSAEAFLNNIANSVLQSSLVSTSIDDILVALNETGFVLDLVKQSLDHTSSLYTIGAAVVSKLYNAGALDGIEIQPLLDESKKTHSLAHALQWAFTSPTWAPGLARLFKTMDEAGVYYQVKLNLFGP
ncbi:hypothetical protein CLIB1423_03S03642 [[Candida] railenensis]|uniref:Opaque-phase-specific protein OP4 n=1 Tax=[Candida] railenensis TaxID=45579 RepID=A0A9P0VWU0_9ASCO|nr:hypothetical protein CLIB1423_03S03642 [[Candida] railenensis]